MEFSLIERIRSLTEQSRDDVRLGIGDDAAVLAVPAGQELAVAIDTLVEGVHFPRGTSAVDIGWKALAVNLSDLAAMGATPAWALLALTLPEPDQAFVKGLAEGFAQLAKPHRLALVGGDTTRGPLSISVAVHGFVAPGKALMRSCAKVGDAVLVTGTLGDAAAGLHALAHPFAVEEQRSDARDLLVARLNRPTPQLAAGSALRDLAHACIDISDGLIADLGHICTASGVGAEIDASLLPLSPSLMAIYDDASAQQFALTGGDDYELCFTVPMNRLADVQSDLSRLGCGVTRIGRIVEGQGVNVRGVDGHWLETGQAGWDHFA
ncbi:thiamine-monophosphate kinase [Rhodanobacter sp. ANJX3]|uniref:thiamine-phosphate kinase n=1 Tax=unclassified Rhodanobacter TaxID=2621553 RepID=UPI0015CC774B|nr:MULTISPECIES: thiamine-phosphate kinase [unclassified Rhodanobacter]MBB5360308.1 thiamine-monophosphate kinase [Rhodanobacter sp. ANJX3]NYE28203.1 thiamine-monophosphate kinase [Rhodanobacter sp. K2T2]